MPGGAYIALSGLRTRIDQLDRLASDLANATTSGYKGERSTTVSAEREGDPFGMALDAAIDVTVGPHRVDFRPGVISPTGRSLDMAIDGEGLFVVDTPGGPRYTRNGHFARSGDGFLVSSEGFRVLGQNGPIPLAANEPVTVESDGTIRAGAAIAGRLQIVTFDNPGGLVREGAALFANSTGAVPRPVTEPIVHSSALEGSNVSVVDRMARLVEVSRTFDALQRGIGVVMNDVQLRAINELGRK